MTPVNIALDTYSILLGSVLIISNFLRHRTEKQQGWIKWMVLINNILAAAHICRLLTEGKTSPVCNVVYPVSIFVLYAAVYSLIITTVVEFIFFLNQPRCKRLLSYSLFVSSIIYFLLLILSPFCGTYYILSEANTFAHGPFIPVPYFLQIVIYGLLIVYLLANRKTLKRSRVTAIITFILFPQLSQFIQLLMPGLYLVSPAYCITFLVMFIFDNYRLEESLDFTEVKLDEKSQELDEKLSEIERSKLAVIKMQNHTIESLSNLVENRDEDTGEHVRRTRAYVELLAVQLMKNNHYPEILNPRYIRFLKRAAPMHDIGKIVVPDAILKKPGRLTEEEFSQMKRHASEGGRIVHEILDDYEDPEYIQITADIAKYHHEKWNGTGYPEQLKGDEIPLCSRIMAIADVFDALVSPRVYKSPMSYEEAFEIIKEGSGVHFDPVIAHEFLQIKEKASSINESFKDLG